MLWDDVVRPVLASLEVENVVGFPAPKHAWNPPSTPAGKARYESYWKPWAEWDGRSDPPEHLARFDLVIELSDARWMPTGWPEHIKGTTAYARQ